MTILIAENENLPDHQSPFDCTHTFAQGFRRGQRLSPGYGGQDGGQAGQANY